eukprot:s1229_g11.t1
MGAFHLYYGGGPEGPAGTGKTESTKDRECHASEQCLRKLMQTWEPAYGLCPHHSCQGSKVVYFALDLAKAVAVQCVVFNCSDGLDYIAMGKFFKGIASSGAWCCFDEFNRINLEVLSVVSQQVQTIQFAIRDKRETFWFEEMEIRLVPSCAVNITMNPGYAGRSELPDNLKAGWKWAGWNARGETPCDHFPAKALFRPCAMMAAALLREGAVGSLRLSSEQLSSQEHYDFGMRALKSILVRAGALRRQYGGSRPEQVLALSALNDVNLPKFTRNDIPLFLGITGDLFPEVELPPSDYGVLINELEGSARSLVLQPVDGFIKKCIQLWETIMVRHGLMLVGQTVSGKTEVENVLAAALAAVADGESYLPVLIHKINPKSITQGQLYGENDEATHEWTDGILALTVRHASAAEQSKRQWILLDGPVDAVWIENLNTVLDDNKKLCLNSGEIIKLTPVTTMMFEVEDLSAASPATVSRCGMVFLEQQDIGWRVLLSSWCERLPDRLKDQAALLQELMDSCLDAVFEMISRKVSKPVPVSINWLVLNLLHLLWALLQAELPLDPSTKDNLWQFDLCRFTRSRSVCHSDVTHHRAMEEAAADGDCACHADELFNLGNKLDEEGRYEDAAEAYQRSVSISEASSGEVPSDVLLNLGFALRSLGELGQARAAWRRALRSALEVRSRAVLLSSGGLCTDPEAVLKLAGVLRSLKIHATVLQGLLPASELHHLRFKSESECLSEVFDSFVLASEPWVRLLCVGETLPRADIAAFAAEVSTMLDVGLLEEVLPGHLASGLQLYPVRGLALLTDWPSVTLGPPGDEPVMAIGTDSLELCLALSPGDGPEATSDLSGLRVLDLCTGSGIAALHALRCGAEEAVAVDLSPRAASIAKVNGIINDLGSSLTVCQGDLFQAIEGIADMRGFDLIVANPPFVAAPEKLKASLYVHGGSDGLAVTRRLVSRACDHLESQDGTLVMIGEFPNLSAEALPPWLPDRPGWNHAAFFAEEHRQSAAVYAADRARPPAEPLWTSSLRAAGVEDMISALIVSSFDGSRSASSTATSGTAWDCFVWPAKDADHSWMGSEHEAWIRAEVRERLPKRTQSDALFWLSPAGTLERTEGLDAFCVVGIGLGTARNVLEPFLRKLAAGQTQGMKEEFGLLCDEPAQRSLRGGSPPFPEEGGVFEYFPVGPSCKWEPWSKKIGTFEIPKDAQAHSLIVPTSDTVRMELSCLTQGGFGFILLRKLHQAAFVSNAFFLQMLIKAECHVLFAGPTGTGKTVVIQQQLLKGFDREKYNTFAFAFSAQSSANQTQDVIDGKLDKRKKGCYGPPFGKRCLVFVDDLNMPAKEKYGAQPPIELLRQWMDTSGWYERKTCEYRQLVDLNFIAALTPSAGRPQITARYLRHYNYFYVLPFEGESLHRIFQTVLQWYLAKFPSQVGALSGHVVRATVDIYHSISANMLPTPAKSHYTFNLRDLAKVNQGICLCSKESLPTPDDFIRCWVHECQRVFQDRLVNDEDNAWFNELLQEKLQERVRVPSVV